MTEFVKVTYTGRDKETNEIFDTNDAEEAKKAKIFTDKLSYKPLTMILGDHQLIRGFEEALEGMKKGEKKTVEIAPEKGYGMRNPELIRIVPLKAFEKSEMMPAPGMVIQVDGSIARVQSVSSGRVRLDFNHELAGRNLVFNIEMVDKIEKEEDKLQALFERLFPTGEKVTMNKTDKDTEVVMPAKAVKLKDYAARKVLFIQDVKKYLKIDSLKVTEQY